MKTLCITVDLDRDVNDAVKGSMAAVSLDRGQGNAPRFVSTGKGTELMVGLLDELNVRATFFAEARALMKSKAFDFLKGQDVALHGLDHEDFSGMKTGVAIDESEARNILESAISIIRDCVGYQPKGIRAPYMSISDTLTYLMPQYGIQYDSSFYVYMQDAIKPYLLENSVKELPVPKSRDAQGNSITGYLWPMHEGLRKPEDFIEMGKQLKDGDFVLATHTWHLCETRAKGVMSPEEQKANLDNVRRVIEGFMDMGYKVRTVAQATSR
jgi:peptidoglycan/xylan/chitin deacetylase (PgdA/CDA1 family)